MINNLFQNKNTVQSCVGSIKWMRSARPVKKDIFHVLKKTAIVFFLFFVLVNFSQVQASVVQDFKLQGSDGKEHKLSDYKGKYIVLEWFNDGCPFVKKHYASGNMQKLQAQYTSKGVVWLTILSSAPGRQGHQDIEGLKAVDNRWSPTSDPTLKPARTLAFFDPEGVVGNQFKATTTPHMYIIDPKMELLYEGAIDDNPSSSQDVIQTSKNYVAQILDKALNGEKVSYTKTKPYGCSIKYK